MKKLILIFLFSIPCFSDSTVVDIYNVFFVEGLKEMPYRTATDSAGISIIFSELYDRGIESDSLSVSHKQFVFWPELDSTVIYSFNWIGDSLAIDTLNEEWMNNTVWRTLYNATDSFFDKVP